MKSKLVYRDEDELDTSMQKVQPLPFLGTDRNLCIKIGVYSVIIELHNHCDMIAHTNVCVMMM